MSWWLTQWWTPTSRLLNLLIQTGWPPSTLLMIVILIYLTKTPHLKGLSLPWIGMMFPLTFFPPMSCSTNDFLSTYVHNVDPIIHAFHGLDLKLGSMNLSHSQFYCQFGHTDPAFGWLPAFGWWSRIVTQMNGMSLHNKMKWICRICQTLCMFKWT